MLVLDGSTWFFSRRKLIDRTHHAWLQISCAGHRAIMVFSKKYQLHHSLSSLENILRESSASILIQTERLIREHARRWLSPCSKPYPKADAEHFRITRFLYTSPGVHERDWQMSSCGRERCLMGPRCGIRCSLGSCLVIVMIRI